MYETDFRMFEKKDGTKGLGIQEDLREMNSYVKPPIINSHERMLLQKKIKGN